MLKYAALATATDVDNVKKKQLKLQNNQHVRETAFTLKGMKLTQN